MRASTASPITSSALDLAHTERNVLANHESGQDHLAIYLRNGNTYLEAMIASHRARVAPFNVSYRYVEDELRYLLDDAKARAVVYGAHRGDSRQLASAGSAHSGCRRIRQRSTPWRCGLRINGGHSGA